MLKKYKQTRGFFLQETKQLRGALHLCDLAGSERLARSQAKGVALKETQVWLRMQSKVDIDSHTIVCYFLLKSLHLAIIVGTEHQQESEFSYKCIHANQSQEQPHLVRGPACMCMLDYVSLPDLRRTHFLRKQLQLPRLQVNVFIGVVFLQNSKTVMLVSVSPTLESTQVYEQFNWWGGKHPLHLIYKPGIITPTYSFPTFLQPGNIVFSQVRDTSQSGGIGQGKDKGTTTL